MGEAGTSIEVRKSIANGIQREGSGATYEVLYRALCDESVAYKGLAEQICCAEII